MKKIIFSLLFVFLFIFSFVKAYEVDLPNPTENIQSEVTIDSIHYKQKDENKSYYIKLFKLFVTYIWLFTGVIAFGAVIYAGFYLLTSAGNPEDLKKANKTLVWGLVGIFVSLLAYVLVKVLINLF